MTTLAIDTSDSQCSAALFCESGQAVSRAENIGRGHAERLLPMIEEVLAEASLDYNDLSRICVVTGPGTFTGLRIGLSAARGLALALNIPCYGFTGLTALAAQAMIQKPDVCVHAVIKGRGGQVYWQAFSGLGEFGIPLPYAVAENIDADKAAEKITALPGSVVGSGAALVEEYLAGITESVACFPDMAVLAQFAENNSALQASHFLPEPTYLRAADAVKAKAVFAIEAER